MRKLFVIALVALLLGVGLIALVETTPGYVLLAWGNYTLETSIWVGVVLLLLFLLLVYLLARLIFRILSGQRTVVTWLGSRKSHHAQRQSSRGLISYLEGNWEHARQQLLRGIPGNEAPLLNYLLAARASERLGEDDKVREYLGAAGDAEPKAAVAVALARAGMQLEAGDCQQALASLNKARGSLSRYPRAVTLLRRAYEGLGDWDALLELLPEIKKRKLLPPEEFEQLERQVYYNRLLQSVRAPAAAEVLPATWQALPRPLRRDAGMRLVYVRGLIAAGEYDLAEKAILNGLKHQWDPQLVREYAFLEGRDASTQLTRAEAWLHQHGEDPQLLLCLGRLCARDRLWGKARDYFESSYRRERSAEVCAELGRLLTGLGEEVVAGAYYREGLLLSEDALPDLPMPEGGLPQGRAASG